MQNQLETPPHRSGALMARLAVLAQAQGTAIACALAPRHGALRAMPRRLRKISSTPQ
jgi:hypothetical protein